MRRISTPNTRVRISITALVRTDTYSNLFFFIFSCNEKDVGSSPTRLANGFVAQLEECKKVSSFGGVAERFMAVALKASEG